MAERKHYDVIIIGGSYAGLSAAMSLGRSLRNVLVIDSGKPCNAPTPHSHNFLTQDGKSPSEISTIARNQVAVYKTIDFCEGLAVDGTRTTDGFEIMLESGNSVYGKKLIVATGIKDQLLDIPGFSACWGVSVIHCPYCHGYEYRGSRTAILGNGDAAMHYALLVSNLTKDLTILTNGPSDLSEEQLEKLRLHNITVVESELAAIEHEGGYMRNVKLKDGKKLPFDALYYKPLLQHNSDIPSSLGCELSEEGYLRVDAVQKTTVDGVYACGDNSSMMRSVANAVATGNFTGAVVNKELAGEQF